MTTTQGRGTSEESYPTESREASASFASRRDPSIILRPGDTTIVDVSNQSIDVDRLARAMQDAFGVKWPVAWIRNPSNFDWLARQVAAKYAKMTGESFSGVVVDTGGGQVQILVDRDTAEYPPVGLRVRIAALT